MKEMQEKQVVKKKNDKALIPLQNVEDYLPAEANKGILAQASTMVVEMGLPKEATVSLIQAIEAKDALTSRIKKQLTATDQEKRKILNVMGFLSPENLKKACEMSKREGVPLDSIAMLRFGQDFTPYVMVKALMMKIDADPRLKKSVDVIDKEIQSGGDDPFAFFRVKIIFWTGQEFEGIGAASKSGLVSKFPKRTFNMEDIINFARTRAIGDAARKALLLSYEVLPEEMVEDEPKDTPYKVVKDEPAGKKNMTRGDVCAYLKKNYDISPADLQAKLSEGKEKPVTIQGVTVAQIWEAAKAINLEVKESV